MPRSSRHKSSKHSAREVRDYSDTEKDVGFKEKKSSHLKESAGEKRHKIDSKSVDVSKDLSGIVSVVADYNDEYGGGGGGVVLSTSSKKRKEKVDDDRWTGGDNNVDHEVSKSESKRGSSRRDDGFVTGFDVEEVRKSGSSKAESKHHRSERKERGEKGEGSERERKGSSRSEKLVDIVTVSENTGSEENVKKQGKHGVGNTVCKVQEEFRNPEIEREPDRRVRRKRDGSGEGDKHLDNVRDLDDRKSSFREEIAKSVKYKDDGHRDERIRDRYPEDLDKDNWHQDDKQRDSRTTRDYASGRSDDKHSRNEKKDLDISQKKSKPHGGEYDRELDRDRERDRDQDRDRARDRERDRSRHDHDREKEHDDRDRDIDRDRELDLERSNDRERNLERGRDRDRELDRDRDRRDRYRHERDRDRLRDRDHNHDRSRERDNDHDHDYVSHVDDKGSRYKEDRGRRRSPDGYDDHHGDKSRRVESEVDKERSLSRKANVEIVTSSSRHRNSPSSRAHLSAEKYRDGNQEETKYGDSLRDSTMSEAHDKVPKYRSGEKRTKLDDNHTGEVSEKSPSTKASPAALKERSPSSTSFDRRFPRRTSRRRSLDVDEAERRSSGSNDVRDVRDVSMAENRQGRDFSAKKPMAEEYPQSDSSFYHKSGQGNVSSHGMGSSGFRTGDSPSFTGSFGEDGRGHSVSRYRRSVDPNLGRGPGNAWKGVHNWPSPLPNGFMPFPPGPPGPHHGGFPPMMSQFPPMFGVRPSMDMNHPGIPYHMADGDRFPGHVRPIGWPNMVDGSVPPHFHGWDANNGMLKDESSMYGPGHLASAQRRDINPDLWKPNGDVNMDVTSGSHHTTKASADEASSAQGASRPNHESSCPDDQVMSKDISSCLSPMKEIPMTPAKAVTEKTPEASNADDTAALTLRAYLAELDISIDLADPELYNQCINLAVKGQSEYIEEEVELKYTEEKVVAESEIQTLTMGVTFFPAVKDSIFQRAMDLYRTQSIERKTSVVPNGVELLGPPASQLEVEEVPILKKNEDSPVDLSIKQEEETLMDLSIKQEEETLVVDLSIKQEEEIVPTSVEEEGKEPVSRNSNELLNGAPSLNLKLVRDVGDDTEMPTSDVEKIQEVASGGSSSEDVHKNHASVESTLAAIDINADRDITDKDGVTGATESALVEPLDVAVSGPLILSSDSVKVCEALISVSDESESVVLSRIHHTPESTH